MLRKRTSRRVCRECRYSLAGLPRQCTCPECGLYDDGEYDYRTTRQRLRDLHRHLAKELREAWPWFAERYVPSFFNAARAVSILLYSAGLCTIGLLAFDAVTDRLGILRARPPAPTIGPGVMSEIGGSLLRVAPLFVAVYALAIALQGMFLHRIRITASATVEGVHARSLGLAALAAAVGLTCLFFWMGYVT